MINRKKTLRIYRELGLQMQPKTPKRRVKAVLRDDRAPPSRAHQTRAMDFVHDQLATGSQLPIFAIVDVFSRFSPAIDPRFSYCGEDAVATLEWVCAVVDHSDSIRVYQGSPFISCDLDLWAYQNNVTLDCSRPGKPRDNAFIEAFNGRLRAECFNTHWLLTLEDARRKFENWRRDYNELRPHGTIWNQAPITFINRPVTTSPTRRSEAGFSSSG